MTDWGAGRYERIAEELAPAAERIVEMAAVQPGEEVLDLACGTGNAALLAAAAGARVVGLDAAERLLGVARERAVAAGADATFVAGDLQDLPFADGSFDAVVSVFGVIFAADPQRAFDEVVRVLRPGGRALLTAWVPAGPIDAMAGALIRAVADATGGGGGPRFVWSGPDAVAGLAAPHGAAVELVDCELEITGASPEDYFAAAEEDHPMSHAMRPLLEQAGTYAAAREEAIAALRDGNEDPAAFRVHSPYRVIRVT